VAPIDFHVKDFVLHGIVPTGERKREAKEKKTIAETRRNAPKDEGMPGFSTTTTQQNQKQNGAIPALLLYHVVRTYVCLGVWRSR
jgi:hypothetical protein